MTRLTTDHPYPDLVRRVRRGPPRWSPTGLIPRLEAEANTVEFFVHHEDVRRAQPDWEPRALPAGLEDQLWRRLGGMARMLARRAPVPVVFRRTGGGAGEVRVGGDGQPVVVSGDAGELMLYAFGRQRAARVDAEGPEDAVRALGAAPLGL